MLSLRRNLLNSPLIFSIKRNSLRACSSSVPHDIFDVDNTLTVSLVGRPNTGKSTLFNRLTQSKLAIVSPVPGTTRDRREGRGMIAGLPLRVIDTGGLDDRGVVSIDIQKQVEMALRSSHVVLFLLDSRAGVTSLDQHFAKWLRKKVQEAADQPMYNTLDKANKKVQNEKRVPPKIILLGNKAEGNYQSEYILETVAEGSRLGFNEPLLISANHGDGLADLASILIEEAKSRGLRDEAMDMRKYNRELKKKQKEEKEQDKLIKKPIVPYTGIKEEARSITEFDEFLPREKDFEEKFDDKFANVDFTGVLLKDKIEELEDDDEDDEFLPMEEEEEDEEEDDMADHQPENPDEELSDETKDIIRQLSLPDLNQDAVMLSKEPVIQIALMGKPNVGKSTLLNAFVGEDRVITGPTAGLTRDSIQVEWVYNNKKFRFVDTAGLTRINPNPRLIHSKKEKKQNEAISKVGVNFDANIILPGIQNLNPEEDPSQFSAQVSEYSLVSALQSLKFAQVVVLVVESAQGKFSKIDLQLARKCLEEGRGLFIAANKYDITSKRGVRPEEFEKQVKKHTDEYLREFGDIPVIACAGEYGKGIGRLLETSIQVHAAWSKRVNTWVLNRWLRDIMVVAPSARAGTKAVSIKYMTQVKSRPPTFALFTNVTELPQSFEKFLRTKLQDEFDLKGVPIRFVIRKSEGNPVKKNLLRQGKHTRRGIGKGEAKGKQGPDREKKVFLRKVIDPAEERRRMDSRNKHKFK